jgi:hypothetical protein
VEKQLKLRLVCPAEVADWHDLEAEECLARFLRTLDAGRRARPWRVDPLVESGRFGWEAHARSGRRVHRVRLATGSVEARPSSGLEWTLTVGGEAGPDGPGVHPWGGEWVVAFAVGVACWAVLHERLGKHLALACALALLMAVGVLLPKLARRAPLDGELDPLDRELLARVRRGAELFPAFRLISRDWEDAAEAGASG